MKPKMGRPTEDPKTVQLGIRFDSHTLRILDEFCSEKQLTRAEGVRVAVRKLEKK